MIKQDHLKLIVDTAHTEELPARFRTSRSPVLDVESQTNLNGLAQLQASAGGRFSLQGLKYMKQVIGDQPITIVDLRQESHGFLNGMAISWFSEHNAGNKGLLPQEAAKQERDLLNGLKQLDSIPFAHVEGKSVEIGIVQRIDEWLVQSEEELAHAEECSYMRFYVTDHHKPSNSEIDRFVAFALAQSEANWLHFHCRGGSGRATTFIILYDMIRHARAHGISLEDFFRRHALIGGKDFGKSLPKPDSYKYEPAMERIRFIGTFYQYCLQQGELDYKLSWSEWLDGQ
ncbi:phosphatase domain-containing protein [Paenibacillus alba]|uniref:Tyrosine specific protein phosphatases domain-containing protein n=1 Tax=Paenibacillus alba TaxID=1197127 RepID=A0ABU6G220_9BACL|nr:hypothetical protein [Paenibacillus alba]MEC0228215.1 hypothetical protein [Paenibacillus alba]